MPMKTVLPVIQGGVFFYSSTTVVDLDLLTVETSRSHSDTHTHTYTHTLGRTPSKRDRPFQRLLFYNIQHKSRHPCPPAVGFEPAIPANECPHTDTLDLVAIGDGRISS